MTYEVWADPGFDHGLRKFSKIDQADIEDGLIGYAKAPIRHPKATRLAGATVIQSFRLRIGPFRVVATLFTSQKAILVATVFRKKRPRSSSADRSISPLFAITAIGWALDMRAGWLRGGWIFFRGTSGGGVQDDVRQVDALVAGPRDGAAVAPECGLVVVVAPDGRPGAG